MELSITDILGKKNITNTQPFQNANMRHNNSLSPKRD